MLRSFWMGSLALGVMATGSGIAGCSEPPLLMARDVSAGDGGPLDAPNAPDVSPLDDGGPPDAPEPDVLPPIDAPLMRSDGGCACGAGMVCCPAPLVCAGMCVPDCRVGGTCPDGLPCDPSNGVCTPSPSDGGGMMMRDGGGMMRDGGGMMRDGGGMMRDGGGMMMPDAGT